MMKTKTKKERRQSKKPMVTECVIHETPQNAFIALFAPIRDESWPNVPCSYLFPVNGEEETATTAIFNGNVAARL